MKTTPTGTGTKSIETKAELEKHLAQRELCLCLKCVFGHADRAPVQS